MRDKIKPTSTVIYGDAMSVSLEKCMGKTLLPKGEKGLII